ncbi:MAG: Arc family DNA-binding protein [Ruminococcus flavefaciens]|nr:Arc family DNA-binding protein [Ruminococcus flavefaciens]
MAVSKAQQKAVAKYMKSNYDELKVRVPKGKKEIIKFAAEQNGKSLNGFINEAIDEKINK